MIYTGTQRADSLHALDRSAKPRRNDSEALSNPEDPGAERPFRPSRRALLLAALYASVAAPGILCSCRSVAFAVRGESVDDDDGGDGARDLYFPVDRSAGTLYVMCARRLRHWVRDAEDPGEYWEHLGAASGSVSVGRGNWVWLELGESALSTPEILDRLRPDSLYRISIAEGAPTVNPRLFKALARMEGLCELDLRHAKSVPASCRSWIAALPLERLWFPRPDDARDREQVCTWAAREGLLFDARGSTSDRIFFRRTRARKPG